MNNKNKDLIEKYKLKEAKSLEFVASTLPKLSTSKFSGTIDIDVLINLKEKNKKDSVKGSVNLPHKFGEDKKIIVICDEKDEKIALSSGANLAGLEKVVEALESGAVDFDVVIATPSVMPKIVKLGKVLGPKGLMPSPKNGTITDDIESTVKSFKSGKQNYKMDQGQSTIRAKIGKIDMTQDQITENIISFLKSVFAEVKKYGVSPFKKIVLKPTMGPSIKLDINDIIGKLK